MRRLLWIALATVCGSLVFGTTGANGHVGVRLAKWRTAIYPQSYFGPNSTYKPSLNIDIRSHQSFDVDMTDVTRHRIGGIYASLKVPCTAGPPKIPIQASNRPTPTRPVPVKVAADGSFSLTVQDQVGPFQGIFNISGRLHGKTGVGIVSFDIDQTIPSSTPGGPPVQLSCHTGQATWHATWHNFAPED